MATSNAWYWWVIPVVALVAFVIYEGVLRDRDDTLLADGVRASAQVVSAEQTGSWINKNPVVALILDVNAGSGPYRATLKTMIPQVHLPAVQPGSRLQLRIDPNDPQHLVIDEPWAR
ncbi:MAG: hypothetical protein KDG55_06160 [Rhodocyclaceae bacterium]|nr:hypothetical protein [Rhodocyclaceae bacterium]